MLSCKRWFIYFNNRGTNSLAIDLLLRNLSTTKNILKYNATLILLKDIVKCLRDPII